MKLTYQHFACPDGTTIGLPPMLSDGAACCGQYISLASGTAIRLMLKLVPTDPGIQWWSLGDLNP